MRYLLQYKSQDFMGKGRDEKIIIKVIKIMKGHELWVHVYIFQ